MLAERNIDPILLVLFRVIREQLLEGDFVTSMKLVQVKNYFTVQYAAYYAELVSINS